MTGGETDTAMRAVNGSSPTPTVSAASSDAISALSGGSPLSTGQRAFFEPRFGRDFSSARIHSSPDANRAAASIDAAAFTRKNVVAFGAGAYQPHSPAGRRLIAHELSHVVQQGAAEREERR